MVVTQSTMVPLKTACPHFSLKDVISSKTISNDLFTNKKGLLIIFLSRHCPYVQHIKEELALITQEYANDIAIVGICSNDAQTHPEDSPLSLKEFAHEQGFIFPICSDETQKTAKQFRAACTPDFFLYDKKLKLVYRGQFDSSRPGSDEPVTGQDLRNAIDALLSGKPPLKQQIPSAGCNIKWKPGNEPSYF